LDRIIKPVIWSTRSIKDLEKITKFYIELYGLSKTREIVTEIRKSTEILEQENLDTSKIGAVDEVFSHLKQEYRKLINHHCKITYREGKTSFYIVRVFDTRQNPNKNK
jgi:plasmid stabilization system protein ParE